MRKMVEIDEVLQKWMRELEMDESWKRVRPGRVILSLM